MKISTIQLSREQTYQRITTELDERIPFYLLQKGKGSEGGRTFILHNRAIFPEIEPDSVRTWREFERYVPDLPKAPPSSYMAVVLGGSTYPLGLGTHPTDETEDEILENTKIAIVSSKIAQATTHDLEPKWQGRTQTMMMICVIIVVALIGLVALMMFL